MTEPPSEGGTMHSVVPLAFIDYNGGPNPQPLNTLAIGGQPLRELLAGSTVIGSTYAAEWEALGIVPHGYITATDDAYHEKDNPRPWERLGLPDSDAYSMRTRAGEIVYVYPGQGRIALNLFDDRVIDALNAYAVSLNRPIFWDNGAGKLENCELPQGTELQGAPPLNTHEFRDAWRERLSMLEAVDKDILNGGHESWYPESTVQARMFEQHASDPWFCRGWDFAEWAVERAGVMIPRLEDPRVTLESAVAYAVCMNAVVSPHAAWHFGTYVREGWKHFDPMLWVERKPVYEMEKFEWEKGAIRVRDAANGIVYRAYLRPDHWREYTDEWEGTPIGTGRIEHVGNGQHPLWGAGGYLDNANTLVTQALTRAQMALDDGYQGPLLSQYAQSLWEAHGYLQRLEKGEES